MPVTTFPMPASGGGGGDGTSIVDDAAFTPGVTRLTPAGGTYRSTRDTINDGDAGAFAVTASRALYTTIETPNGDSAMDDTNDAVKVNIVAGAGSGGTSSNFGAALPSAGTAAGFDDGTNMEAARVYDTDSGAGSEFTLGVSLRKTESGGSVELGTLADPVRIDPTGTTIQPVSAASLPLPTGAATEASLADAVTALQLLDNTVSGTELQVDIVAPLPAGTNAIGKLAANSGIDIGDVDVTSVIPGTGATNLGKAEDAAHANGDTGVAILAVRSDTLAASSGTTGDYEMVKTNADGAVWTTSAPSSVGGLTTYHLVSAASTNATNIKASAGQLYGWYIYNSNAAARKVALHNSASTPTAGASVFFSIMIPPYSAANILGANGIAFSSGIGITTVTEVADNGTTGVGANDLIINLFYK